MTTITITTTRRELAKTLRTAPGAMWRLGLIGAWEPGEWDHREASDYIHGVSGGVCADGVYAESTSLGVRYEVTAD